MPGRASLGLVPLAASILLAANCGQQPETALGPRLPGADSPLVIHQCEARGLDLPDDQAILFIAERGDTTHTTWGKLKTQFSTLEPERGDSCQCGNEI